MGLGYVVTRDLASFLRYELQRRRGQPEPARARSPTEVGIRRAYGSGISSTGMYMRDFLYLGFNEDEAHRKVFDAVQIVIPGTHRLFANVEFADPNTYSRQDVWHDSAVLLVSAADLCRHDRSDLRHSRRHPQAPGHRSAGVPGRLGERVLADERVAERARRAGRPVPIPDNVRLYFASSFQHVGVRGPAESARAGRDCAKSQTQGNGWAPTLRALLVALDEWADRGVAPPKSNYPRSRTRRSSRWTTARAAFPAIPACDSRRCSTSCRSRISAPASHRPAAACRNSRRRSARSIRCLLPKPEATGSTSAASGQSRWPRRPRRSPAGTFGPKAGGPTISAGLSGAYIPFAKTKAERQRRTRSAAIARRAVRRSRMVS